MYNKGRPSSFRIGGENYRTNSSYGDRWSSLNDTKSRDRNDRYSPNNDYDRYPPRNVDSENPPNRDIRYYDNRRIVSRTNNRYPPSNDNERNSPRDTHNGYNRNSRFNDYQRTPSPQKYDRRDDDIRNYTNDRHLRDEDVGYKNNKYSSDDGYDRCPSRNSNSGIARNQVPQYYDDRRASYKPQYNSEEVKNFDDARHPKDRDFSNGNYGYLSDDDYDRTPPRNGESRTTHARDPHYYDNRRASYSPEYDRDIRNSDNDMHSRGRFVSHTNDRYSTGDDYNRDSYDQERHRYNNRHTPIQSENDRRHDDVRSYAYDEDLDTSQTNNEDSSTNDNDRRRPRNSDSRMAHDQNQHCHDDRQAPHQRYYDRHNNARTYDRYSSDDDYDRIPPRSNNYQTDYNQHSNSYDNRRVSHSPQSDRAYNNVEQYLASRTSNYRNVRDQTRRNSNDYDNSVRNFSNRQQHQTTPPRWSIDGEPVTFTEYRRFQANSRRRFEKKPRYIPDYDSEEEFEKLVNKMKIGQPDREKLAEEMGFNDPLPPRRGGVHGNFAVATLGHLHFLLQD